jgi:3-dehydroquinate dehydratase-2
VELGREVGAEVRTMQRNQEGAWIDALQGVIFNPGGYTHTSATFRDAITAIRISVIEVYLSNVYAREDFRHTSLISAVCKGKIVGFGCQSYSLGLGALMSRL